MKRTLLMVGYLSLLTGCASDSSTDYQDLIPITPEKLFPGDIAHQEVVKSQEQQFKLCERHDKIVNDPANGEL